MVGMNEKEFRLEALRRLVPDTSWHGDFCLDRESLDNIEILDSMFATMLNELLRDCFVPEGNKDDGYYKLIASKKQEIIKNIRNVLEDYDDSRRKENL